MRGLISILAFRTLIQFNKYPRLRQYLSRSLPSRLENQIRMYLKKSLSMGGPIPNLKISMLEPKSSSNEEFYFG
jgi:hypothetical protein